MKILIAVPTFENIYPDTFKSIYDLDVSGADASFEFVRGYDCAKARNVIVTMAVDRNADYVFMVDSDMVLPKDALRNLLDDDADVVYGYCARRGNRNLYNGRTSIFRRNGEKNYTEQAAYTGEEMRAFRQNGDHKIQIHGAGMACALVQTDVFRRLKFPWFRWVEYDQKRHLSEDLYFCSQCNKAKIPLYVDTRVECGHVFRHIQYAD